MPIPKPKKNESKDQFVTRFMESEAAKEFKTQKQRLAVAFRQWEEKGGKK